VPEATKRDNPLANNRPKWFMFKVKERKECKRSKSQKREGRRQNFKEGRFLEKKLNDLGIVELNLDEM
jgi:hypothetical protein